MIIVRLMGGLGNQMFQYALGRRLSVSNDCDLWLDTSFLLADHGPGITKRGYSLGSLQINARTLRFAGCSEVPDSIAKAAPDLAAAISEDKIRMLYEQSADFDESVLLERGNICLVGFWQSENYFLSISDTIRKEFRIKEAMNPACRVLLNEIESSESIAIHVRRGDYVTNPNAASYHGTCSPSWYKSAISALPDEIQRGKFVIFSDDIDWAKTNLTFVENVIFVDNRYESSEAVDLYLMSCCKHQVIANSSFSWWAAWLNPYRRKVVIAPKQWFIDIQSSRDRIPSSWKII